MLLINSIFVVAYILFFFFSFFTSGFVTRLTSSAETRIEVSSG